jgi:hypothetical protein
VTTSLLTHDEPQPTLKRRGERLHPAPTQASLRHLALAQLPEALRKLDPRHVVKAPVVFVVWVGSILTTALAVARPSVFAIGVTLWLWATVLFANLAEAIAEAAARPRPRPCGPPRPRPSPGGCVPTATRSRCLGRS